jgi:tetratricopeptide (TPR) repeat protein
MPILELAHDTVLLSVGKEPIGQPMQITEIPLWQRWNDYGIGLIRSAGGMSKGQLRQAAEAFGEVAAIGHVDGTVNLGRTLLKEGRIDEAATAFASAAAHSELKHPWTLDFYSAKIERERGALDEAIARLRRVRASKYPLAVERGYDFGLDERVLVELATLLFEQSRVSSEDDRGAMLEEARALCQEALRMNPQRSSAWYALFRANDALGHLEDAKAALSQFDLLRPDDNARDRAILIARSNNPEANHAAEPIAIYDLDRRPSVSSHEE